MWSWTPSKRQPSCAGKCTPTSEKSSLVQSPIGTPVATRHAVIMGQESANRALEVAAAGGHNILK